MVIFNYGISFGSVLPGILVVSTAVWLVLAFLTFKEKSWMLGLAVLGGGLNLVERLMRGYVSDYWKIPFIPLYNNLNDWLIFIGVVMYIWKKFK
jgi:lipoprotein signal peptidase